MKKDLLFVGVGGQGTILASKLLCAGLIEMGYDVKMSEIHGMAQRGGSVVTQVRFAEKVHSPVISPGEADVIVAFETVEALRYLPYLKKGGTVIVNDYEIPSLPVLVGAEEYPADVIGKIREVAGVVSLKAGELAAKAGTERAMNVVIIGALVETLGLEGDWSVHIKNTVPERFLAENLAAFDLGRAAARI